MHNSDGTVRSVSPLLTWHIQYIAGPLHGSQLKTKTDPKEWRLLFARIFDGKHHSFGPTNTKTTRNQDATRDASEADHIGLEEALTLRRRGHAMRRGILQGLTPVFQIQGLTIQPTERPSSELLIKKLLGTDVNDKFAINTKCRVFKRFDDRHIRILQICIFSDKSNGYRIKQSFLAVDMSEDATKRLRSVPTGHFFPSFFQ